jgi:hypothetical protein
MSIAPAMDLERIGISESLSENGTTKEIVDLLVKRRV